MKNTHPFFSAILCCGVVLFHLGIPTHATAAKKYWVQDLGVVGDGITDDGPAFQAAIHHVLNQGGGELLIPPEFQIRTLQNIYVYKFISLVGHGKSSQILLDGDLTNADGVDYWINFGIKSKGGDIRSFSGRIENLRFKCTANGIARRLLQFHVTDHFHVKKCIFDSTASNKTKSISWISSQNDAAWTTGGKRLNGYIAHNTFYMDDNPANGGEAIGLNNASYMHVTDNSIHGCGDDAVGLHTVSHSVVANNQIETSTGRILLSNCDHVQVTANQIKRIQDTNDTWHGAGSFIHAFIEYSNGPSPKHLTIAHNHLICPAAIPSFVYGIRLLGVRDAVVTGNTLQCDSPHAKLPIRIEPQSVTNWSESPDTDGIARPRNIVVSDNHCTGLYPPAIEQVGLISSLPGPYLINGNLAGGYEFYAGTIFANNALVDPNPDLIEVAGSQVDSTIPLLNVNTTSVTPNSTKTGFRPQSSTSQFIPQLGGKILRISVMTDQSLSSGHIKVKLYRNGIERYTFNYYPSAGLAKHVTSSSTSTDLNFLANDVWEIKCEGNSTLAPSSGIDLHIEIHGMYVR